MFKKSISCLLAALMIIASMPFSAISASAANGTLSANSYQIVRGGSNTRWENNQFNIVNDQEADNTSIGIIKYDISSLKGMVIDSASLNFTIDSHNDDSQGLVFYYSNRLTNVTLNNSSTQDTLSNYGAGNVANESAASRYGFSTDNVLAYGNVNTSVQTSDVKTQLQTIVDSGATSLYVFVMQKTAGGLKGDRLDGVTTSDGWTDTKIKPANVTINYETSEYQPTDLKPFVAMTANDYGSFSADNNYVTATDYATVYKNIVYAPKKMSSAAHTSEDRSYEQQNKMYGNMSFWYGNTVMLYDGETSPQFAVGFVNGGKSIPWNWNWGNNRSYYCKTLTDGFSLVNTKWHGADGSMNAQWLLVSSGREVNCYNDSNNSGYYTQGKQTGYYANIMQYSGGNFSENYISKNLTFEYKVGNDWGTGTYSDTVTEATIYVLNYKKVIENVNTARDFYNTIDKAHVNRDSLIAYATAVNNLQAFNPSDYDYSTNTANAVAGASDKMTSLINAVNQAKDSLKYDYTFIDINNNSTVVTAKNANEAYSKKPTNTETNTVQISDTQHTKYTYTWPTNPSGYVFTEQKEEVTENHDFSNYKTVCSCGYEPDFSAYNNAAGVEFQSISSQSTFYDDDSFSNYDAVVRKAASNRNSVHSQKDIDDITYKILYAKSLLRKKQGKVTLTVYDANGNVVSDAGDTFTGNYGDTVTVKPKNKCNIVKWVIETNTAKKELVGELQNIDLVVTGDTTVKAYCDNSTTDTENSYTKVIFKGSNGKVSAIKYVKVGEKLKTDTVEKPSLALYTIGEWNVSEVVGSADKAEVTVIAPCEPNTSYQCGIHFAGKGDEVIYKPYDTRIDINDYIQSDNVTYALATDELGKNIIAYIDGTVFYVPARADVYVVKKSVGSKETMINTVGVYTTTRGTGENTKKTIGFNCKFSLAEGCQALEWGVVFIPIYNKAGGGTRIGTSTVAPIRSLSAQNEYTARINIPASSTSYNSIKAKAYLKYRDEAGEHVIYGNENTQAFDTNTRFWEVK